MENENTIIQFYQNYDEDNRMARNPLEYIRCKEIISRYLSESNMDILDVGGATGAFSFWLAEMGHRVSLVDFTQKHIELAQQREQRSGIKLSAAIVADARQLPFQDNRFDMVLLMGPLYHLQEKEERIICIKEAYRVLKPNGIIICEAISRFASMLDGFVRDLVTDSEFVPIMRKDIQTGIHIDTSSSKDYFTNAYLHLPEELLFELQQSGFTFEELIAVTGFGNVIPDIDHKILDDNYRKILLDTLRLVEKDPTIMGISSHFMGIGRKEQQ